MNYVLCKQFSVAPFVFLLVFLLNFYCHASAQGVSKVGETNSSAIEWNDFYHSPPGTFHANTGYRITFYYKVIKRANDAKFYLVVNDSSQKHKTFDWQDWTGKPGAAGNISTMFIDRDSDDYTFVVGIHNQGSIHIYDVKIAADPLLKPLNLSFPGPHRTWHSPASSTYYIDSVNGSDGNSGKTSRSPWRTLKRINEGVFSPGDRILLHCGSVWNGYLTPAGSGSASTPIVVDSYGSGPKPQINGQGLWLAALYLSNESYVTIRNLNISNHGHEPQPKLTGVSINEIDFGTASSIHLDSLDIHDVTGSELKTEGGGAGINCTCVGEKKATRFDGLLIENCRLTRTDRNGITVNGAYARIAWYPCLDVVIRHNILEDIGGDGIVPVGCDGALIEYNVLHGGRMRTLDYAAGIWPWSCDDTIVQFNEVSGMRGTNDGEGFDSDWNCRNSLFQ